jgi:Carboxypeptidase regulatory-like domain
VSLPPTSGASLSTMLRVSVKVINEKGQAIKSARVTLLHKRGKLPVATGLTGANGVYQTKTLIEAGDQRLRVEADGYVNVEDQIEVIEGSKKGNASITVRLKKA